MQGLARLLRVLGQAAVTQLLSEEDGVAGLDWQADHAGFFIGVAAFLGR